MPSRRPVLRTMALLAAVGIVLPGPADAQGAAGRIAAVVNDDVISTLDLAQRVELIIIGSSLPGDNETRNRLAPQVLRGLIDETLQLQEAQRLRIDVGSEDIDRAFASVAERNNLTPEQLAGFLRSRGLPAETLRRQLEAQIAWLRVVNREINPRVSISNEQVDLAIAVDGDGSDEIRLAEILLPVYTPAQEAEVLTAAAELADSIRKGASFSSLARELSISQSAQLGGDLGWVSTRAMVPELQPVIARMTIGDVSDPIRTAAGVHLVQLNGRRSAGEGVPDQERRAAVEQRLTEERTQMLANRYLRDLRREAFIEIRL